MRYITAFLGAALIFIGAFILTGFLFAMVGLLYPLNFFGVDTNNPIGFILSSLAATASYKATLARYKKRDAVRDANAPPR